MPSAPLRQCSRCGLATPNRNGVCDAHQVDTSKGWNVSHGQNVKRMRGATLQAARRRLYAQEPYCRQCKRVLHPDRWIRDHIIPMGEGGTDDPENVQPLCFDCSREKTHAESIRARR